MSLHFTQALMKIPCLNADKTWGFTEAQIPYPVLYRYEYRKIEFVPEIHETQDFYPIEYELFILAFRVPCENTKSGFTRAYVYVQKDFMIGAKNRRKKVETYLKKNAAWVFSYATPEIEYRYE